jgi:hypothetical protein
VQRQLSLLPIYRLASGIYPPNLACIVQVCRNCIEISRQLKSSYWLIPSNIQNLNIKIIQRTFYFPKPSLGNMGINFSRFRTLVPEQFLDIPDINPVLK